MSTKAESVLRQIRELPVEDQEDIARALKVSPAIAPRRLEDVLGKYVPLPRESEGDSNDHNEWFVEAIEYFKGINHGPNSVR